MLQAFETTSVIYLLCLFVNFFLKKICFPILCVWALACVCAPCAGLEPAEGSDEELSWEVLGTMTVFSAGAGSALS